MKIISCISAVALVGIFTSCAMQTPSTNRNVNVPIPNIENRSENINQNLSLPQVDAEVSKILTDAAVLYTSAANLTPAAFEWQEGREEFVEKTSIQGQKVLLAVPDEDAFLSKMATVANLETAGSVDADADEPKIWKMENYPIVCLAGFQTPTVNGLTLSCGRLPDSAIFAQPALIQAFHSLINQIGTTLPLNPTDPKTEYFRWYDKDKFNKEYVVKGMSVVYPENSSDVHERMIAILEKFGFAKTQFQADGPLGQITGLQKDKMGCLLDSRNAEALEAEVQKREPSMEASKQRGYIMKFSCSFVK